MRRRLFPLIGVLSLVVFSGCAGLQTRSEAGAEASTGSAPTAAVPAPAPAPEPDKLAALGGKTDAAIVRFDDLPVKYQGIVNDWIGYFQGKGRPHMMRYLSRSTRYVPMMKRVLRENGLPEDLVYISLIESGYSPRAHSTAGAVGYWQFMRGTGRNYGLRVNHLTDDRMDPEKSTEAAAMYFKGLYNLFGSWPLAIAAYNVGENRIKSVVMRKYTRDLWELIDMRLLPKETAHYVPKFIAAEMIAREPDKYGFNDIPYEEAFKYEPVSSNRPVDLRKLAENLKLPFEDLRSLNPAYRTPLAPLQDGRLILRVPLGRREDALASIEKSHASAKEERSLAAAVLDFRTYRVKKGDTLSGIARRHGVSLDALKAANSMGRGKVLRVGSRVEIPAVSAGQSRRNKKAPNKKVHVVRRGETLSGISKRYEIPVYRLTEINGLGRRGQLAVGKRLVIPD